MIEEEKAKERKDLGGNKENFNSFNTSHELSKQVESLSFSTEASTVLDSSTRSSDP